MASLLVIYLIMNNIKINFSQDCIATFNKNSKLYSYLYNSLSKAYFKLEKNHLNFYLKGDLGLFEHSYPVEYDGSTIYFSIDYTKWVNSIMKFINSETGVNLEIADKRNSIKLSTDSSSDVITLSITKYSADNALITTIESGFSQGRSFKNNNLALKLNDDIVGDLTLADSLFNPQGNVNSIGVSKEGVIYADKLIVLTTKFENVLDDSLFKGTLDEDEGRYFMLHQYLIGLINFLYKENDTLYFNDDYSTTYWESDDKALVMSHPYRELVLPTSEDLLCLYPGDDAKVIVTNKDSLIEGLDFFNGFYEGSAWKPITFSAAANKEVVLRYRRPEADLTKTLYGDTDSDGSFILSSDSLKKVLTKVRDKREDMTDPLPIEITFDEDHEGVLFRIGDYCTAFLAKLIDDSEI